MFPVSSLLVFLFFKLINALSVLKDLQRFRREFHAFEPCRVGSVGRVSASRTVGREFASRPGHTKDHHKMVQTASLHGAQCVRVGVWQCSPTVLKAG